MTIAGDKAVPLNQFIPGGREIGCLLIHGLTGGSHDLRPLAIALRAAGFPLVLVQLPGHGTNVKELACCSWEDWYEAARQGLAAIRAKGLPVATVGLSMGSLLALQLASDCGEEVTCIVALSCALTLAPRWLRAARPVLAGFARAEAKLPALGRLLAKVILPKGKPDIADQAVRIASPSYERIPLRALMQLSLLQERVSALLPGILQPTLIVHGAGDRTCPPSNVEILARSLGSTQVKKILLNQSSHVVTVDKEKDRVVAEIIGFLDNMEHPAPVTSA